MVSPLLPVLAAIAIALLIGIFWAATVVFVCRDVYRNVSTARQQRKWAALSLIPFVGFVLYLVNRRELVEQHTPPRRETMLRPQRTGGQEATVAAADYARAAGHQGQDSRAAPRPASPCLYVTRGPHEGQEFAVGSLPALIGRETEATIQLERDPAVSRRHAELYEQDGMLWLRDLGSRHGTLVNERPAADQELVPGDTIQVGSSQLVYKGKTGDAT
jgi:hypothetical protein